MAWHKGVCQPAAFCLLGGKHEDTYIRMINELHKAIKDLGLEWKPKFVSLDFEMGSQLHPNIWLWVEFIQEEDLQMSIKFMAIEKDKSISRFGQTERL